MEHTASKYYGTPGELYISMSSDWSGCKLCSSLEYKGDVNDNLLELLERGITANKAFNYDTHFTLNGDGDKWCDKYSTDCRVARIKAGQPEGMYIEIGYSPVSRNFNQVIIVDIAPIKNEKFNDSSDYKLMMEYDMGVLVSNTNGWMGGGGIYNNELKYDENGDVNARDVLGGVIEGLIKGGGNTLDNQYVLGLTDDLKCKEIPIISIQFNPYIIDDSPIIKKECNLIRYFLSVCIHPSGSLGNKMYSGGWDLDIHDLQTQHLRYRIPLHTPGTPIRKMR
jgi:hypothetical protein